MSAEPVAFEAQYTSELIERAALAFVRQYLFRRYGRWLLLACIINAAGLALALGLGFREPAAVIGLIAIIVLGPLYLALVYLTYPAKFSGRLKQVLLPSAHFSMSVEKLQVRTNAGTVEVPWPGPGSLLERESFSLLALSPLAFVIFPTASLPPSGRAILQRQGSARVA